VPLSPSSTIWYQPPMDGDARRLERKRRAWWKLMAAYRRLRSPAGGLPRTGISSGTYAAIQLQLDRARTIRRPTSHP